jgi:hypothetical protein
MKATVTYTALLAIFTAACNQPAGHTEPQHDKAADVAAITQMLVVKR